jgi:flagellar hook-basal body complex protein FliE
MATPLAAASAYANIARIAADPTAAALLRPSAGNGGSETSFTSVLKEAMDAVNEAGKKSDTQTRAMVNGKSNMVDVVTAVAETEVAIDAVVAVRDKVIAAYEEIMRMPI